MQEVQETQVQALGQEDPLEQEMVTHSSTLAWKIPWTEEPGWATVHGVTKSGTQLSTHAKQKHQFEQRVLCMPLVACVF